MSTILTLAHCVLNHGLYMSTGRYRFATTAKFVPFARVEKAKLTDEYALEMAYQLDTNPQKINLAGEVYRNGMGKPYVIQAVRKAEIGIASDESLSHEPEQPLGNAEFIRAASELILSQEAPALTQNRVLGIQTRSSIDALRLAGLFLRQKMACNVCMLARPSCKLYELIFKSVGFTCQTYQYYSEGKGGELNIYGLVADLMTAPEGSVVLLDACAQNPTGLDPTIDEWKLIAHIIKCKNMIPLFHLDAHGLASGDAAQDTWAVRYFVDNGFDVFCAQSFVKNFGLYNETVGQLMVVLSNSIHMATVREQFEIMLLESNEPCTSIFASRIVAKILNNTDLRHEWTLGLKDMHQRIRQMRAALINKLEVLKTPGSWEHLKEQLGPQLYTNLQQPQLMELRKRHVYVPNSGRINVGALRSENVDYVAGAINDVMLSKKDKSEKAIAKKIIN